MKLVTVVGARPQFIKASVLSGLLKGDPRVQELIVHTGQHYDPVMSGTFFEELDIPAPFAHLGIGSGHHGAQTGKMLGAVEALLIQEKPDVVLVYGDTNSTLAGALAAAKLHIPVAHVEAGLRSFNRAMPEEINRIMTDHLSTWLFTPTRTAVDMLLKEGFLPPVIHQVGDIMLDAARRFGGLARERSRILESMRLEPKTYLLATIHRAENTDAPERLATLFQALEAMSRDLPVILPLHGRTIKALETSGIPLPATPGFRVIKAVGYLDMVRLEENARLVATDSGGVQKESFFHGVPCVTLREETEWTELVEMGWNRLAPPTTVQSVVSNIRAALDGPPGQAGNPFGDGHAAERILAALVGPQIPGGCASVSAPLENNLEASL